MPEAQQTIKVGCCGFRMRKRDYFEKFSTVELQSTFYQPPARESTPQRWRKQAPSQAEFVVKAWQLITHPSSSPTYRRLRTNISREEKKSYGFFKPTKQVLQAWEKTKQVARSLGTQIILFQCPGSFKPHPEHLENFKSFFKNIQKENFTLVWEPRGKWEDGVVKELCQKFNLVHCTDPFKQKPVYGQINYFRLHGKPGYNLKYKYTDQDLHQLKKMCDKHTNYCMFNNFSMVQDAQRFLEFLQADNFYF